MAAARGPGAGSKVRHQQTTRKPVFAPGTCLTVLHTSGQQPTAVAMHSIHGGTPTNSQEGFQHQSNQAAISVVGVCYQT